MNMRKHRFCVCLKCGGKFLLWQMVHENLCYRCGEKQYKESKEKTK